MGKRLIGKGILADTRLQTVLKTGTLAIIAGTTNGYVAEEILTATGQGQGFSRKGFRRGMVTPPGFAGAPLAEFEGDVILIDGVWQKGKTIFDVVDDLKAGDIILKGANALDVSRRRAAVYIADPHAGTIGSAMKAIAGRRVQLIIPVGLEKRIAGDIAEIAAAVNAPDTTGPRMLPLPGNVFTELDAVCVLTGASARLLAGGGIYGAEGAVWLGVSGTDRQLQAAESLINSLADEPLCEA